MTYLKRHVASHGELCLFCECSPAVWKYAAFTEDDLTWHWAMCDVCSDLIDADRTSPLVNRFIRSRQTQLSHKILNQAVQEILDEFRSYSIPTGAVQ
jgi:hypothetical protein